MADLPLSGLAAATGLTEADLMLITQSSVSKNLTVELLKRFLFLDGRYGYYEHNDWLSPEVEIKGWFKWNNGAGASVGMGNPYQGRNHVVLFQTGTTATATLGMYQGNSGKVEQFGDGETVYEASVLIRDNLSTPSERFAVYAGFGDTFLAADMTNGAYFRYSDNINGGKWQISTADGAVRTQQDSGITVAIDTWYTLKVVVNAAGTSAEFFIDGVSIGTITTNIPTGSANNFNPLAKMPKLVGTTNRMAYIDYVTVSKLYTTPR